MALDPRLILGLDTQAPVRTSAALGLANDRIPALKLAMGLQELQNQQAYRQAQLEEQRQQTAYRQRQATAADVENQRKEAERKAGLIIPYVYRMASAPTEAGLNAVVQEIAAHPELGPEKAAAFAQTYRSRPVSEWTSVSRGQVAGTPEGQKQASQLMFAPPKEAKPPSMRTRNVGGTEIQEQWNAADGKWEKIGEAPRWKAEAPGEGKPPSGYRWKADGSLEPIPGGPGDKQASTKAIPFGEKQELTSFADNVRSLSQLKDTFKNEYASMGMLGGPVVGAEQSLGSWANAKSQERAAWWSNYQMLVELPERHKLFGAALTATEQAAWNKARNIKPGSDAKLVKDTITNLLNIYKSKMDAFSASLKEEGKAPAAVDALTKPSGGASGGWSIQKVE